MKTYAAATGPGATEERWKHIMDEAEAEEVVKGPDEEHTPIPADTPAEEGDIDEGSAIEGTTGTEETAAAQAPEVQAQDTPLPSIDDGYPSDASMDAEDAATRGKDGAFNELAAKRPREDSAADADAKNLVGSASTGPTARKKRPEPKTNIQVGERRPPKPPS